MNYKIVRNAAGEIVCFGPNNNHYEPTIKAGETLTIEDAIPTPLPTYKDLRAKEYPPIGDQLDAIWKGGDAQADMLKQVMAVKHKYPKG